MKSRFIRSRMMNDRLNDSRTMLCQFINANAPMRRELSLTSSLAEATLFPVAVLEGLKTQTI